MKKKQEASVEVELQNMNNKKNSVVANKHTKNKFEKSNPWDFLSYGWLNSFMWKGFKTDLKLDDAITVCKTDEATYLTDRLQKHWEEEIEAEKKIIQKKIDNGTITTDDPVSKIPKKHGKMIRALGKTFYWDLLGGMIFGIIEGGLKMAMPVLLGKLTRYFDVGSTLSKNDALMYAGLISFISLFTTVIHHVFFLVLMRSGMRMRIATSGLIYRKLLHLKVSDLSKTDSGHIINLASNDVQRFDQLMIALHFIYLGPLETLVALVLVWLLVGPIALCGFWILILIIPLQSYLGKAFLKLRSKATAFTDERVRKMNEIISGMRVIKMYAWESAFHRLISIIRADEINRIRSATYIRAFNMAFSFAAPGLIAYGIFVTYQLTGGVLTPEKVYTTVALFNVIKLTMTIFFPMAIQGIAEVKVTINRLESFLKSIDETPAVATDNSEFAITTYNINALWEVAEDSEYYKKHQKLIYKKIKEKSPKKKRRFKKTFSKNSSRLMSSLSSSRDSVFRPKESKSKDDFSNSKVLDIKEQVDGDGDGIGDSVDDDDEGSDGGMEPRSSDNFDLNNNNNNNNNNILTTIAEQRKASNRSNRSNRSKHSIGQVSNESPIELKKINVLTNLNFRLKHDQLLGVVGPVGSGKSSLLMALLGELPVSGDLVVNGKVSYASQEPWIINGTIKENILFGLPFDEKKYNEVIDCCELKKDLEIFQFGDNSYLGERGINLSGGQKARISLARAIFRDSDVYLLDDPLSAVDAVVGRNLFDKCIRGYLKGKCVVLVTHQLQFLPNCDLIMALSDGRIEGLGTYDDLKRNGFDFSIIFDTDFDVLDISNDDDDDNDDVDNNYNNNNDNDNNNNNNNDDDDDTITLSTSIDELDKKNVKENENENKNEKETENMKEKKASGSVSWTNYIKFYTNGGKLFFPVSTLLFVLGQGLLMGGDYWLSRWTTLPANEQDEKINLYVYTALVVGTCIIAVIRAMYFFHFALTSSKTMHNKMFGSVLRAIILFFDNNSTGVIINRFSKDIGFMDDLLPLTFFDFLQLSLIVLGNMLLIAIINPWVFIVVVPLLTVFYLLRTFYLYTSRDVKRLEGMARSPLYAYFNSTLAGISVIRAFRVQGEFQEEFHHRQNEHTRWWFMFLVTSRWLGIRLDFLATLFIIGVCFLSIFAKDFLDAGKVALSLTYALQLQGLFQWCVRQSAEVENQMTSVERVLEYCDLPSDGASKSDEKALGSGFDLPGKTAWPTTGSIKMNNVTFRYSPELPKVLDSINCEIESGHKIGVVGRTGAGKSTIMTVLFRLLEIETDGSIEIDGVDTSLVGTEKLRKSIAVIPQDPVLFSGSVRFNIDPFNNYDDVKLWDTLREVKLYSVVRHMGNGLDSLISEGGSNLSVGQRQLFCLARALLGETKILIMDEATANVDIATDSFIQDTIQTRFSDRTVLTIAHRINTLNNSDKIMVLSFGKLVEYDTPANLMAIPDGHFNKLVNETKAAKAGH